MTPGVLSSITGRPRLASLTAFHATDAEIFPQLKKTPLHSASVMDAQQVVFVDADIEALSSGPPQGFS